MRILPNMPYIYLTLAFTLNAFANVLLKIGSSHLVTAGPAGSLLLANWRLLAGLALFVCNAVFYALALRTLPISIAYPIMVVMSFIIINGFALTMLGEYITLTQIVGYAVIIAGLFLVVARI